MTTPIKDNVLIEPIEEKLQTEWWFHVAEMKVKEKTSKWKVIAVWIEVKEVGVWDIVHFMKYSPDEIEVDGKVYAVIKESSILAKDTLSP